MQHGGARRLPGSWNSDSHCASAPGTWATSAVVGEHGSNAASELAQMSDGTNQSGLFVTKVTHENTTAT